MAVRYPNVNAAHKYARDVVSGRINTCLYVRQACQRHLDDLKKSKDDKSWAYRFDKASAERVCRFIQKLVHTKGKWAKKPVKDRQITLESWQLFIHTVIYGWMRRRDKTRRFRYVYIEVPRKNGKSIIAAGNGHYLFCADGEYGAEIYCGATTERQAWEVFKPARQMAKALPQLVSSFGIDVMAKKLERGDGSIFEPIIGDPPDGSSPHGAIIDEYHEHDGPEMFDTMATGVGAREQPLIFVITTAGSNIAGPCKDMHDDLVKVLSSAIEDDELFGIIYTIDDGDDWTDPKVLEKANPNLGVSVNRDYLESQQKRAIRNPRYTNVFKTKHLDVWVNASSAFYNLEDWKNAEDLTLRLDDFIGCDCWISLDLATKLDVCSVVIIFARREEDGQLHYYVFSRHFLPEDTIHDPDQKNVKLYQQWLNTHWDNCDGAALKQTDGAEIDFNEIQDEILGLTAVHNMKEIPYDPWNSAQLAQELAAEGLDVIKIPQVTKHLSPAMKEMEAALRAGRFHHDGNPVLTWMISNVVSKEDANENVFPRKDKPHQKIDGAVASIMGIGRAMLNEGEGRSAYEDEDYGV
ncbi:terminase large subunit [Shewanella surugensis]|uniref:Terminase large subunit n=1 Tax=Shewanella surugensis TaxID=212020 RepID=A0ABT0LGD0_9GAMM|nr:terminase TerL endonuclease subunit [Shewanella surugensis]MCL1126719.1 terminase large subunit [Shewanella surugensis]